MKKRLFLLLMLLLSSVAVLAQNTENKTPWHPSWAIRGGFNYSTMPASALHWDWREGANFGITVDLPLGTEWAARPGFYYTMKGYKSSLNDKTVWKLNYLEIPLAFVHKIRICNIFNVELQIGSYFAYGVSPIIRNGHLKRFDWGPNAGLGFNIWHIYLGATYDFGVVSLINHGLNQCFMTNIGYVF